MSSSPLNLVSEYEYLHTAYRPDCDYVDGFVLERNLGTPPHARLQTVIAGYLLERERQWQIHVVVECRLKIRPRKYRVPDIMVLAADTPRPQLAIEEAPLFCIEVVSPKDRLPDLVLRAGDYSTLGVAITWILDPQTKQSFVYDSEGLRESFDSALRHAQIELPITDLFAQL